ncbi:MAG: acetyl-CoA carboxylase carboxyltransferase subunit alpha [Christensenellales bacterium]|jgi:acetyl-CoA carboxylase carboxyl transferase subunit alpha
MSEKVSAAWEKVGIARDIRRPTAAYYIEEITDDFIEMHGDRAFGDDRAIIGGIGSIGGHVVTILAQEKGDSVREKANRNFGCAHPEGYRKTLRLMKQAEKFSRPVVCIVDTQGAYCGVGAEERGIGEAIARNLLELSRLKTPVVCVLIGEGGSGGALALAVSDRIAMLENAVYSILSPEGFASILWKDASRAAEAAAHMKMTAEEVRALGLIDDVLAEPAGGAQEQPEWMAQQVKRYVVDALEKLKAKELDLLLEERYEKLRSFGNSGILG